MYQLGVGVLQELEEPFWLDFGTLLGYYRGGDIIPHDIDIDVGMMESSYEKITEMKDRMPPGLSLHDSSANHNGPKVYFSYKGFDFDVFFYKQHGDHFKCYLEGAPFNETQLIHEKLIFPLKEASFKGKTVQVPKDTEGYLQQMYGYLGMGGTRNKETGLWEAPA